MARCLNGVAHIIHAGDIGAEQVVEGLRRIAPVTAIRGNVDTGDWARDYRDTETVLPGLPDDRRSLRSPFAGAAILSRTHFQPARGRCEATPFVWHTRHDT